MLDRQSVAVPTRHVRRVEAHHRLRLDDDVLEDFVQRVAHVNVAVRVRRAVVQNRLRPPFRLLANELVEIDEAPLLEPLRLVDGQVGLHREGGLRKVQRLLVVTAFGHGGRRN